MKSALILGAVLSMGVLTNAQTDTCIEVGDCGPQEGYPYYYDWSFNPSPMIRLAKVSFFNTLLPAMFFITNDRADYETANGTPKDWNDFSFSGYTQSSTTEMYQAMAIESASVWGIGFLLYSMALIGFAKPLAAFWIKHVISNLNFVAYGYIAYLFWD